MNPRIEVILKHRATLPTGVGVIAFGFGAGLGYILGKRKRFGLHVVPPLESVGHIDEVKETDEGLEIQGTLTKGVVTPGSQTAAREAAKAEMLARLQGVVDKGEAEEAEELPQPGVVLDDAPISRNIFANNGDDEWDYEEELKGRVVDVPYVLHRDEFFNNEKDFPQITLTYFEGDEMMVGEDDNPIYNYVEQTTGPLKFGHGSGDPNIFYVRNERNRAEYEVLRHEGMYALERQGLEMEQSDEAKELKHSDRFKDSG